MLFFKRNHLFLKYLIVSALNTLFGLSLLYVLSRTTLSTWEIVFISNACGIIFNYNSFGKIAFNKLNARRFKIYFLIFFSIYIVQIKIIAVITPFFNERIYSIILAALITTLPNFYLLKNYVFKNGSKE